MTLLDYGGAVTRRHLVLDSEGQPGINLRPRDLKNVTLLDYGGAVTWRHLVLDSGQTGIRSPTKSFSLPLIGPNKKGLHIIGQIIDYVTDLKNVTLLDYGGVVAYTWY